VPNKNSVKIERAGIKTLYNLQSSGFVEVSRVQVNEAFYRDESALMKATRQTAFWNVE
jgi:hypothetical protein